MSKPPFAPAHQSTTVGDQVFQQAITFHAQRRLVEAEQAYRRVLKSNDRHFGALYQLGILRLQQGRFDDAVRLLRRAINVERTAEAYHHLAFALMAIGRTVEAIRRYEQALAIKPDLAETHNNLGHALEMAGRIDASITHYTKAIGIKPAYAEAHNNLGNALHKANRSDEALAHYQKAIAINPRYTEAHDNMGTALSALGRYEEAIACYRKALAINRDDAEIHNHLGTTFHAFGRSQEAIAHHQRAVELRPHNPEFYNSLGNALNALGRLDEAVAAYGSAITPGKAHYFWNLANAKRFTASDSHLIAMQNLAKRLSSLPIDEQIELHFALGKALTDIGDHQQAFDHILRGNTLKRQQIVYAESTTLERLAQIRRVFSADLMHQKQGFGDPSPVPIFILGMPRSGTTLVEQILASHPKVFGAGELAEIGRLAAQIESQTGDTFPDAIGATSGDQLRRFGAEYVHNIRRLAPQADRITNKMPANYLYAGLIHLILPNARIIRTCRDLRDTALSCFSILWPLGQDHTYDLAELGRYCRGYKTLMEHWHNVLPQHVMLDVQYEVLVTDLEQQAWRIVAHCGLEWDDACLAFYQTDRVVRTASASQVRQPIYTSSVGRWRTYESRLQPLLEALEGQSPPAVVAPRT